MADELVRTNQKFGQSTIDILENNKSSYGFRDRSNFVRYIVTKFLKENGLLT